MSHIVKIETQVKDEQAIREACKHLSLGAPVSGQHKLYDGTYEGIGVKLPSWQYPIVINPQTGAIQFDNYGGTWGEKRHLDAFVQRYAIEKARIEAQKKGYAVREETLKDGSVKVTITQRS